MRLSNLALTDEQIYILQDSLHTYQMRIQEELNGPEQVYTDSLVDLLEDVKDLKEELKLVVRRIS